MSFNATRLTLYAILSALEADLRDIIIEHLSNRKKISDIFGSKLIEKLYSRLQKDIGETAGVFELADLVHYLDFDETFQLLNSNRECLPETVTDFISAQTEDFQKIAPVRNRVMHARPLDFDDLPLCLDIVDRFVRSKALRFSQLETALQKLKEAPAYVFGLSIPVIRDDRISHNLPIPDFDETGFIGRKIYETQLQKWILGPYPVITVVGEGGLGKTALVLKVAYSLLDKEESSFDAIVWSTAKANQITAQEIVRIKGAIADSLGLLQAIQKEIAGKATEDPIDEIIDYLKEFKILLILDNLETVSDSRIHDFLGKLPAGSKVVITSRIGLGEFERRLRLDPLDENDACRLLYSLAKVRGIDSLTSARRDVLLSYCRRMKNNPGYIKWFVSAIQTGQRPEQVLDASGLFLDYCMSNVYNYLAEDSHVLLQILQVVAQHLSQAELAFLAELDVMPLQQSLHQLTATNMVRMLSTGLGSAAETKYGISDLAREYLMKHHAVPRDAFGRIRGRYNEIAAASRLVDSESRANPYSYFSIVRRSSGEKLVAKYLLDALQLSQRNEFAEAFRCVEKARGLAPHFFEVHRVAAIINASAGNVAEAEGCYAAAIELEPESAPLRYWFGNFLARGLQDQVRALEQLQLAEKLDPSERQISLEKARCLVFLGRYREGREILNKLVEERMLPPSPARKAFDLILQSWVREAEFLLRQKDYTKAVTSLGGFIAQMKDVSRSMRDKRILTTIRRGFNMLQKCRAQIADGNLQSTILEWKDYVMSEMADMGVPLRDYYEERWNYGTIIKIVESRFGFIRADDDREYYFSVNALRSTVSIGEIVVGKRVKFELGVNSQGQCAVNIHWDVSEEGDDEGLVE